MNDDPPYPAPAPSQMPYDPDIPNAPEPDQQDYDIGTEQNQQPGP